MKDAIDEVDEIEMRNVLDKGRNNYGNELVNFLKLSKMAIVNGRITRDNDNFTRVSHRGCSVVDYVLSHHCDLRKKAKFQVKLVNDILKDANIMSQISHLCKAPDHSLLVTDVLVNYHVSKYFDANDSTGTVQQTNAHRRYNISDPPPQFMNNQQWRAALVEHRKMYWR